MTKQKAAISTEEYFGEVFNQGEIVVLDKGTNNEKPFEVAGQTTHRIFTLVKVQNMTLSWWIETNRLSKT